MNSSARESANRREACDRSTGFCFVAECDSDLDCPLGERCSSRICVIDLEADRDRDGVPDGSADTRVDNQFSYVRHVCPHLEPVVNALPDLLEQDALAMMDACDVVVVTQGTKEIRQQVASRLGRIKVIDLVRLFEDAPDISTYEGIGW